MGGGSFAIGRHPVMGSLGIVGEVFQFVQGVSKALARLGECGCEVAETCFASCGGCGVADVEDHSGCDGGRGVLPVALHRTILAGADNHVGDVLCVGYVAGRADAHLGQRVESGAVGNFDW